MSGKSAFYLEMVYSHTHSDGRVPYYHSPVAAVGEYPSEKCSDGYKMQHWEIPAGSGRFYNICVPIGDPSAAYSATDDKHGSKPMTEKDKAKDLKLREKLAVDATKMLFRSVRKAEIEVGKADHAPGGGGGGGNSAPPPQGEPPPEQEQPTPGMGGEGGKEEGGGGEVGDAVEKSGEDEKDVIVDGSDKDDETTIPGLEEDQPEQPPDEAPPETLDEDESDGGDDTAIIEEDEPIYDESEITGSPFAPDVEEDVWFGDWCPSCATSWINYIIQGIPTGNWHTDPHGPPFLENSTSWSSWVLGTLDERIKLRKGELGIWMETGQYHWASNNYWRGGATGPKKSTFVGPWETTTIYHTIANDEATDVGWGQKAELGLWADPKNNIDAYSDDYMRMTISYGDNPYEGANYDGVGMGDTWRLESFSKMYDVVHYAHAETRGLMWRLGYGCYPQFDFGVSHTIRWPGDGCRYTYSGDKDKEQAWAGDALTALDFDTDCSNYEYSAVHCWYQTEMNIMLEIISSLTPLDSSRYYKRIGNKKITASDLTGLMGDEADSADAIEDIYGTAATTTEMMRAEGTYEVPSGGTTSGDY